ncbi:hypothetical protein AMR41_15585 [Hapalosiphon sp. MRB220]|nr:hypothetical protein AMR41_15585 [Hapalosiphon sp. MRB220]
MGFLYFDNKGDKGDKGDNGDKETRGTTETRRQGGQRRQGDKGTRGQGRKRVLMYECKIILQTYRNFR